MSSTEGVKTIEIVDDIPKKCFRSLLVFSFASLLNFSAFCTLEGKSSLKIFY